MTNKVYRISLFLFLSLEILVIVVLAVSVRTAFGFAVLPLHVPILPPLSRRTPTPTSTSTSKRRTLLSRRRRLPSLKYAYAGSNDDDNTEGVDINDAGSAASATTRIPFIVNPDDDIRFNKNEQDDDAALNTESTSITASQSTDISAALKEVLTAAAVLTKEDEDDIQQLQKQQQQLQQRLILPIHTTNTNKHSDPTTNTAVAVAANININNNSSHQSDTVINKKKKNSHTKNNKIDLGRRWRRLRPGQKFRLRLGAAAVVFVSLWDTIGVRNFSGVITGIVTGAAATTTTTGFGGILRRWFSNRGFQGIAALGRSIAYGWAILVAYPRMLDRRSKDRRLKRDEEAFKRWNRYLQGTADEAIRLRRELSLLEGEIRTFRREILAIRAARINGSSTTTKTMKSGGSTDSNHLSDIDNSIRDNNINNNNNTNNNSSSNNESDRILRDAVINEMSHLTRLRDDTRLALTTARQRWSEVRAKRPISNSKSASTSAFDALEFELDTTADFDYDGRNGHDYDNDDILLSGF